ncbi:MAG: hypothetical protein PF795_12765 [Kiritimatiellae bacterium]|nr:hypothetical protein [Kiritimatiellia bacterium]
MDSGDLLVTAAEKVVEILNEHHVDAVVIGAVALAAHQYVRLTDDLDLAVNADLGDMRLLVEALHQAGYQAEFREPDGQDPLGGVIDVLGLFGLLQIISFADRFPAVIDDAVKASTLSVRSGSALRLIPIPHLVALKLYAGGLKSKVDIVELLSRNPQVDLKEIQ